MTTTGRIAIALLVVGGAVFLSWYFASGESEPIEPPPTISEEQEESPIEPEAESSEEEQVETVPDFPTSTSPPASSTSPVQDQAELRGFEQLERAAAVLVAAARAARRTVSVRSLSAACCPGRGARLCGP